MRFTKNQLAVGPYCAMDHIMIAILLMGDFLQMQLTVYIYIHGTLEYISTGHHLPTGAGLFHP